LLASSSAIYSAGVCLAAFAGIGAPPLKASNSFLSFSGLFLLNKKVSLKKYQFEI
jgi:hypothetical protein